MVRALGGIGHLDDGGVEWPAAPVSRGVVAVGHRNGLVGDRVPARVSIPARARLQVGARAQAGVGIPPGAGFPARIRAARCALAEENMILESAKPEPHLSSLSGSGASTPRAPTTRKTTLHCPNCIKYTM